MNVQIIATKQCMHRPSLEKELQDLHVNYRVLYVEEHPDLVERLGIRHSPNLVVDDQVAFRGQPTEAQLKQLLGLV